MGRPGRIQPEKLAAKLKQIRESLGLSQPEMAARLSSKKYRVGITRVSDFELGRSEPNLITLLEYAKLVDVHLEVLADDDLDLPARIKKGSGVRGQ